MNAFSDEQLWALVYRPFALAQDVHLRELTALGKAGHRSDAEQAEMERLIDLFDQYVLVRSQALVLLKQRGYDVEQRLESVYS